MALFGADVCEVVCVLESFLADVEERDCGGASTPKAELWGTSSSIFGGAGASLFGFSGDVGGRGAFRFGDCDICDVLTSVDVLFLRFSAAAVASPRWASKDIFGGVRGGRGDFDEVDFIILSIRARSAESFGDFRGVADMRLTEVVVVGCLWSTQSVAGDCLEYFTLMWPTRFCYVMIR